MVGKARLTQWPAVALDRFRRALAGAARAIARDPEVEVVFASERAAVGQDRARAVARPGLEPRLVAEARGAADALALRLRHHDAEAPCRRGARADAEARAVFDALETARVEALGARAMAGVRANLADLAEARVRGDAIIARATAKRCRWRPRSG